MWNVQLQIYKIIFLVFSVEAVQENCHFKNGNIGRCVSMKRCSAIRNYKTIEYCGKNEGSNLQVCCVVSEKIVTPNNYQPIPAPGDIQPPNTLPALPPIIGQIPNTGQTPVPNPSQIPNTDPNPSPGQIPSTIPGPVSNTTEAQPSEAPDNPLETSDNAADGNDNSDESPTHQNLTEIPTKGDMKDDAEVLTVHQKKCDEYSHQIKKRQDIHVFIIGGTKSPPDKFPHMAALGYGDRNNIQWLCGGSLISEEYIVTAAHCLTSQNLGDVKWVKLGDTNLIDNTSKITPVLQTISHPDYHPPSQYNDIALLKISPVAFSASLAPICLKNFEDLSKYDLTATGWGRTTVAGPTSADLMEVKLEYFPNSICQQNYELVSKEQLPNGINEDIHLCAGSRTAEKDTCQGDSGGPLQINEESTLYLVGITSFGRKCGVPNSPGVYTRVSHYISWIEQNVWS